MAVGHFPFPKMPAVGGVRLAAACAGIKSTDRNDLVLLELAEGSSVAGVFTRNAYCAAPVVIAKEHLRSTFASGSKHYWLINAGNANACTGERGMDDARSTCAEVARLAGVSPTQVLPFSTGVIGESLPVDKMLAVLPQAFGDLADGSWEAAARAIMTTDTRPKAATVQFEHEGVTVTVNGMAKGSGMIKPDMATMLAYVMTDAKVAQPLLDKLLRSAVERSFNRITVDGDTSTNDACMLAATGRAPLPEIIEPSGVLYAKLYNAVVAVHIQLAQAVITDGEGATKFVTVAVEGGANRRECLAVAYTVAESPLVKTALFASDPNWGRTVMAIGRAGIEELDVNRVKVYLGDVLIVERGGRADSYTEEQGQQVMARDAITIRIDLGRGSSAERVWTTDLSHDYVTINAEYRT
ncbi:bifunctional glutamate N-acetyltransferase/amino-acid acetyltransferase ArgJ [Exilibacterium tricleocarpae]|uniref:Arginine biosynthesis bifunctional protein ArgJ n=1 Tax=Exilibacterium tricleocarpae TaxID=2591008 RepID=A0A545TQC5_9GAMM|nr:bifunctional glutamate N-acetyltransferase/amino-acid acetyltransferase ArgJ [Exilibacterium tricleocarpae]TQV79433.1 bifunctional glutamate N-acetyltransferase/amino-acid acetyltransferase ArgJ [Exilibacterium tricleocarpae]